MSEDSSSWYRAAIFGFLFQLTVKQVYPLKSNERKRKWSGTNWKCLFMQEMPYSLKMILYGTVVALEDDWGWNFLYLDFGVKIFHFNFCDSAERKVTCAVKTFFCRMNKHPISQLVDSRASWFLTTVQVSLFATHDKLFIIAHMEFVKWFTHLLLTNCPFFTLKFN